MIVVVSLGILKMSNQIIDVDKIVQEFVDSGSKVFDGEGYDQKTLYKILQHPDFPLGVTVNCPD